jgi:hypothetical protein
VCVVPAAACISHICQYKCYMTTHTHMQVPDGDY